MTSKDSSDSRPRSVAAQDRHVRPGLKWVVAALSLLCLAGLVWHFLGRSPGPAAPAEATGAAAAGKNAATETSAQPAGGAGTAAAQQPAGEQANAALVPTPANGTAAPPLAVTPLPGDPALGALVAGLKHLSGTNGALTPEAAAAWRTNLMNLVRSGPAAIPALRAFLDQKEDFPFSQDAWLALGYSSARLAAIDALRQIGGTDAVAAMQGLLDTTQSPREIAVLARDLEEASPGQYRDQSLAAARAGLAAAAASKDPQVDVAPLFEVFQHYGDAAVIPELERATDQWKYYATIALANLPDNAGVPAILRLADPASGSGSRVVALEMLAQLATTNPDANQFLAAQVANKSIPPNLWPYLTGPLAGDQYYPVDSAITQYPQLQSLSDLRTTHIAYGNQNLYNLPGNQNLTSDGINQRLALVDELLKTASDPAAVQALQEARSTLTERSTRAAAQTQPATGSGP